MKNSKEKLKIIYGIPGKITWIFVAILFSIQLIFSMNVFAQQRTVSGIVTDSDGQPLPGVTVVVTGTTIGTVTNSDGGFSLNIPANAEVLHFSFVGMRSQDVPVAGRTTFTVVLEEETIGLDEVVAIGYGTQRKATLTGSVATVDNEFLESRPITSASQALQGSLGLYVNQEDGGQPGRDQGTIRIRGIGTLNNNNPLVLVDGVPYSIQDVNPQDIESISILKDAASAAIYGNRAANGVILITTKGGRLGEKMTVELHSYIGAQTATVLPDMVTNSVDYMMARDEAAIYEGQPPIYGEEVIEEYRNGTDPDIYPNTDWYDIMFSTALIHEHNLRVSGGSNIATYALSVGYLNQEGIMMGTGAKRYSLNSNTTYKVSPKLEFGAIINASFWNIDEPSREGSEMMSGGPIGRALPIHPNILTDGRYGDTWLVTMGHNVFRHPVAIARESWMNNKTERAMINLFAEYKLPFDLTYKANFATTNYTRNYHRWIPEIYIYNPKEPDVPKLLRFDPPTRSVDRTDNKSRDINFFQTLNWTKNILDNHNISALFGFSMESFYNNNLNAYIEGFLGNELTEINSGTSNKDVGGTSNESKLMSYFGRASYNYSDKYLLEFNFRYDGSSRFAKGNRWGFFPSVSGAWNIQNEPFMEALPWIYNLKLRGSWGQLGNQSISLYSYLSNVNTNQNIVRNGTLLSGSAITTLSDPNITWETTTMTNIGLDFGFLGNRLVLQFDVFDKSTTDILARINIPAQVGNLNGPITNLYSMKNKGLEIAASYRGIIRDFNYNVGGNVGFVDNKVTYLAGDIQYDTNMFGNVSVIKEGYPVNSWYLYEAIGIFQSQEEIDSHAFQHSKTQPGDIKYRDLNGDEVIDIQDMSVKGRSIPKATYGFNLDMGYKNISLTSFWQGVYGIDAYPWHNIAFPLFNGAGISKIHFGNQWTPENRDAKYPRPTLYRRGSQLNSKNSTFWLQDLSYLRLKNVQLSYNLTPDQFGLLRTLNISNLKLYINGQNLLTFTPYELADPEKDITDERAADYPNTKMITAGFNLKF